MRNERVIKIAHLAAVVALLMGAVIAVARQGVGTGRESGGQQNSNANRQSGNTNADHMNIVVNPGAELIAGFSGTRLGGAITLAGGTITRAADAPAGEAIILESYGTNVTSNNVNAYHNNILDVTASSTMPPAAPAASTSFTSRSRLGMTP